MKIISTSDEKIFNAKIQCQCETVFEFESSDMIVKGNYAQTYHVTCPTCHQSHNYTESMTEKDKKAVDDYINSCRSCMGCKYMAVIKEGYSSYTITNISIHCKMKENPNMPLTGYEDSYEKESVYAFAEKCNKFRQGVNYIKEVEESEHEAFKRWEEKNNNFVSY